ncbi:IS200/IS605 family transposase [Methylacidiphilum fumariolicum]|nr:IS200/IS605 family transposase [Candidatus Methylacidiphilum fumarolicum]
MYNIGYHLIWCPKYRRKVLVGEVAERLKELLHEKARKIEVEIVQMEVMPDHIHAFVKTVPTNSPHFIVQQLKGYPLWRPVLQPEPWAWLVVKAALFRRFLPFDALFEDG